MAREVSASKLQYAPPPLRLLARESAAFVYMRVAASFGRVASVRMQGEGQPVVILPGFMASDQTTGRLRRSLNAAGFRSHGWGLGRNTGITADMLERFEARLNLLEDNEPVTLVGWSLGGLVAREFAKLYPHRIAKVITLGSPFSGNPRHNNAWRVYELIAGHKVDNPPLVAALHEKPPMQTIAFWSPNDGVVASGSACGLPSESDRQIRLECTHMAFVALPESINAIATAIVE